MYVILFIPQIFLCFSIWLPLVMTTFFLTLNALPDQNSPTSSPFHRIYEHKANVLSGLSGFLFSIPKAHSFLLHYQSLELLHAPHLPDF